MEIISLFKGESTNAITCKLYRVPTKAERHADLGNRDAEVEYVKADLWDLGFFIPKRWGHYLVYLKRSDGAHTPVGGVESADHAIVELRAEPFRDPELESEPSGPANRSQPVRSPTNQPPAAAGSGR
jgi:hypothetical protein